MIPSNYHSWPASSGYDSFLDENQSSNNNNPYSASRPATPNSTMSRRNGNSNNINKLLDDSYLDCHDSNPYASPITPIVEKSNGIALKEMHFCAVNDTSMNTNRDDGDGDSYYKGTGGGGGDSASFDALSVSDGNIYDYLSSPSPSASSDHNNNPYNSPVGRQLNSRRSSSTTDNGHRINLRSPSNIKPLPHSSKILNSANEEEEEESNVNPYNSPSSCSQSSSSPVESLSFSPPFYDVNEKKASTDSNNKYSHSNHCSNPYALISPTGKSPETNVSTVLNFNDTNQCNNPYDYESPNPKSTRIGNSLSSKFEEMACSVNMGSNSSSSSSSDSNSNRSSKSIVSEDRPSLSPTGAGLRRPRSQNSISISDSTNKGIEREHYSYSSIPTEHSQSATSVPVEWGIIRFIYLKIWSIALWLVGKLCDIYNTCERFTKNIIRMSLWAAYVVVNVLFRLMILFPFKLSMSILKSVTDRVSSVIRSLNPSSIVPFLSKMKQQ